jgi:hypothetical protein
MSVFISMTTKLYRLIYHFRATVILREPRQIPLTPSGVYVLVEGHAWGSHKCTQKKIIKIPSHLCSIVSFHAVLFFPVKTQTLTFFSLSEIVSACVILEIKFLMY